MIGPSGKIVAKAIRIGYKTSGAVDWSKPQAPEAPNEKGEVRKKP